MILSLRGKEAASLEVYDSFDTEDDLCFRHVDIVKGGEYPHYVWLKREDVKALRDHLNKVLNDD